MSRGGSHSRDSGRERKTNRARQALAQLPATLSGTTEIEPDDDLVISDDGPLPRVYKHEEVIELERSDCGDPFEQRCVFYALKPDCASLAEAHSLGILHRDGGPAVLWQDGDEEWYQFGQLHRDDGPALVEQQEELGWVRMWFQHGEKHRDDLPAVESQAGHVEWWRRGLLHRDDGPAVEIADEDGEYDYFWYREGKLHRDGDLPAVIRADGSQEYYQHGFLHREDGKPAWISATGEGVGWWVEGRKFHPDPDQPACIDGDGGKTWYDSRGLQHRGGDLPAFDAPGRQNWYLHGERHRSHGKPASIWDIAGGSQIITWTEHGIDKAELTVPEYATDPDWEFDGDLCLTVFASKAGEFGYHLETVRGIARYLATAGLQLGDEIDFSRHPELWAELKEQLQRAEAISEQDDCNWVELWWE